MEKETTKTCETRTKVSVQSELVEKGTTESSEDEGVFSPAGGASWV